MENNNKTFWNDVAKYGLLLGIAMGASKIFEQALFINGGISYVGWVVLEWILFAIFFMVFLYKITLRQANASDPAVGYSFFKSSNYMVLVSIFAAVPVTCIYYIYVNSILGYDNYVDGLITVLVNTVETYPVDSDTAASVDLVINQLRSQAQPSIFEVLFNTICQYTFAGLLAGLVMSGFIAKRAASGDLRDE